MDRNERAILERWLAGRGEDDFRTLVDLYGTMVYATCRRIVRHDADAEDLTQECLAVLLRLTKPPKTPLGPWLHRVATNLALNHLRAQRRRAARERAYSQTAPIEQATRENTWAHLDKALSRLPDRLRVPLVAHYLEGRTQESIAASVGTSRQTVGYRIGKGLEALRKALAQQGIGTSTASLGALLGTARAEAAPLSAALRERLAHLPARLAVSGGVAGTAAGYGVLQWTAVAVVVCGAILGTMYAVNASPPRPVRTVSPGTATVTPAAPAPAQESLRVAQAVAETPKASEAPATASVSGHVFFPGWVASDGPVGVGASLRHENGSDGMAWKQVEVGEEYHLEKLPPGEYTFSASLRGARGSVERTLGPGDALQGVDIHVASNPTVVCGFARDPDGQPIAGAAVRLSHGVATRFLQGETVTDENGYFEIRHVAGSSPEITGRFNGAYILNVTREGYHTRYAPMDFQVQEGERFEANVVLVPGRYSLSGRVVTPTGAAAPGAVIAGAGQTTRSGPDGVFRLDRLLDKCEVSVRFTGDSPYYKAEPEKYEFQGGSDEEGAVFTVWPGGSVVGRLASADGAPFSLESLRSDRWRDSKTPVVEKGKLYASGTAFEFVGLPPEESYILAAADESHAPALVGPLQVKPGERLEVGTVTFGSGGRIVGRLVFPPEWSWGVCSLSYNTLLPRDDFHFRGAGRGTTATSGNGYRFELAGLMPGRGKIHYQGAIDGVGWGIDREVVVREGETLTVELPVTLPSGGIKPPEPKPGTGSGVVEGSVVWDNGAPVEHADIRIDGTRTRVENDRTATDQQGRFRFEGLDPQDVFKINAEYRLGQVEEERREVRCGNDLRIVFGRTLRVLGRLAGTDGRALCRAQFSLIAGAERRVLYRAAMGADGRFLIEDNEALKGDLVVEGAEFAPTVVKNLDLRFGDEVNLGTVTVDPGMDFSGSVVGEDGQPVAYAEVTSVPVVPGAEPKMLQRVVTADSRGRFVIPHAQEGPHRISVTAPGCATTETEADLRTGSPLNLTISPVPVE